MASKFKIGDKVVEIKTGDRGTIVEDHPSHGRGWWVKWETGNDEGEILFLEEYKMELDTNAYLDMDDKEITIDGVVYILKRKE